MRGSQVQQGQLPPSTRAAPTPANARGGGAVRTGLSRQSLGSIRSPPVSSIAATPAALGRNAPPQQQAISNNSSVSLKPSAKAELAGTLRRCIKEVQLVASDNQALREGLEEARTEIVELKEQLQKQNQELQRVSEIELTNLRLQAQILALERERAPDTSESTTPDADLQAAYDELKMQHEALEKYYSDLLALVKDGDDKIMEQSVKLEE